MSLQERSIVTDGDGGACASSVASAMSASGTHAAWPTVEPRIKEVGVAKDEIDPNRICCHGLFEAELVDGRVVLQCLSCGSLWSKQADGTLAVDDSPRTPRRDV